MKRLLSFLLIGLLLLSFAACQQTTQEQNNDTAETGEILSDEELVERLLYLHDPFIFPVHWWTAAGSYSLDVDEFVDPLEDTPEYTAFYPVNRFNSIVEMKRATEQVMTKEYAETYLYPQQDEINQFLERDGKLYMNTEIGGGAAPFMPVSATVLEKTANEALLSVVYEDTYGEQEVHEVELKRENGIWKLNNYPYLNGSEANQEQSLDESSDVED